MPILCPVAVVRCERCLKPIAKKAPVEVARTTRNGPVYVHENCTPYSAAVPRSGKPVTPLMAMKGQFTALPVFAPAEDADEVVVSHGEYAESPTYGAGGNGPASAREDRVPQQPQPEPPMSRQEAMKKIAMDAAEYAQGVIEAKVNRVVADAARACVNDIANEVATEAKEAARDRIDETIDKMDEAIQKAVLEKLEEKGATIVRHVHVISRPEGDKEFGEPGEAFHVAFPEVLKLASHGFNVLMIGPSGSGKTHLASQVARALGLPFGMVSGTAGTTESELFGSSYPNVTTGENVYLEAEFVTLYENGGLFLLDEADAMDANCLLKINAAIANGFCAVPKRFGRTKATRHEKFVFLMAANTWGQGATRQYCGRNKLDEATLDRFRLATVAVDYDPALERRMACPDPTLYGLLAGWRQRIMDAKLQRILSTRFMCDAYIAKHVLKENDHYIASKLVGGWSAKETKDVLGYNIP